MERDTLLKWASEVLDVLGDYMAAVERRHMLVEHRVVAVLERFHAAVLADLSGLGDVPPVDWTDDLIVLDLPDPPDWKVGDVPELPQ